MFGYFERILLNISSEIEIWGIILLNTYNIQIYPIKNHNYEDHDYLEQIHINVIRFVDKFLHLQCHRCEISFMPNFISRA